MFYSISVITISGSSLSCLMFFPPKSPINVTSNDAVELLSISNLDIVPSEDLA